MSREGTVRADEGQPGELYVWKDSNGTWVMYLLLERRKSSSLGEHWICWMTRATVSSKVEVHLGVFKDYVKDRKLVRV